MRRAAAAGAAHRFCNAACLFRWQPCCRPSRPSPTAASTPSTHTALTPQTPVPAQPSSTACSPTLTFPPARCALPPLLHLMRLFFKDPMQQTLFISLTKDITPTLPLPAPVAPVLHRPHTHNLGVDGGGDAVVHLAVQLGQRVACRYREGEGRLGWGASPGPGRDRPALKAASKPPRSGGWAALYRGIGCCPRKARDFLLPTPGAAPPRPVAAQLLLLAQGWLHHG